MVNPNKCPIVGFEGTGVFPLGAITLAVRAGDYPRQITREMTFLVVNCSFVYNAILRRPILNSWTAVASAYHLMIKSQRITGWENYEEVRLQHENAILL